MLVAKTLRRDTTTRLCIAKAWLRDRISTEKRCCSGLGVLEFETTGSIYAALGSDTGDYRISRAAKCAPELCLASIHPRDWTV